MVAEVKKPEPADPLHGFSIISLLPRTNRDFDKPTISEQGDMEFLQSYLKSVTIECPDKHLEQAKAILSSTSELQKSEFPCPMLSADKEKLIPEKGKDRPQERRPGLGRKRARFSFKPNTSQPALDENLNLNIDQLQDPEEFFAAFEKLENAKKELQKQRGDISTDRPTHNTSTTTRNRRPGILGKTAVYKHRHSSVFVDSDEAILSSQEIFETDVPSQTNNSLIVETTDQPAESKEKELAGHGHIEKKDLLVEDGRRLNSLLDEMLSTNCTDLDEDGAVTFLQDRLQIKPFSLEKLCLPKFDSVRRSDLKATVEQLSRPRKALSDIHNKLRRVSSKTTTECQQVLESSMFTLGSPNPPRSPFSAMAVLKKRISQMEPPVNPFSFCGIDTSPARHCSQVEGIETHDVSPNSNYGPNDANDKTSAEDNGKKLNFAVHFQSLLLKEDNPAGSNMVSKKLLTENSACPHDMPMDDGSNIKNTGMNIRSSGSNSDKHKVPPHFDYVHNDACNSDTPSVKLNKKRLSFSRRLQSPVLQEDNIADSNMVSRKLVTEILASPDITMNDSSNRVNTEVDITLSGSDGDKHKVSPNADYDHNVQSPMLEEDNTAGSNMLSKKLVTETSASPPGMPMDDGSNIKNAGMNIRPSGSDSDKHEVPPHVDYVHNDACNSDTTSVKLNEKRLSFSQRLPPPVLQEDNIADINMVSGKLVTEILASPDITMDDSSNRVNSEMDITLSGSDGDKHEVSPNADYDHNVQSPMLEEDNTAGSNMLSKKLVTETSANPPGMPSNDNSNRANSDIDIRSSGSNGVLEDNDKDTREEAVAPEHPELDFEGLPKENMDYGSHLDQFDIIAGEHLPKDGYSKSQDIFSERNNETRQEPSGISMNDQNNQKTPPHNQRKRKSISKRKSLSGKLVTENLACPPEMSMNENSSRLNTDMDIRSNGSDDVEDQTNQESSKITMNEKVEQEASSHNRRKRKATSKRKSLTGKLVTKSPSCLPEKSMDENSNRSNTNMDIRSSVSDAVQDQTHQEGPPRNRRKRREISNRKSLAGAGTVFDAESGRRKSTRNKSKPLEFWKGERFLLGRVHETLITVIGVRKYESPASAKGKGKKRKLPTFKVESWVSEEFKDLVDLAALH